MVEVRPWKMSIVESGMVDPRTLVEHPLNPKIHTEAQDAVVAGSLSELGWLRRLLWNRRTGHVLDGHERLKLALERGEALVPVDVTELPESEEGKVLLVLDQSAALAQPHLERWAQLRAAVQTAEPALLGFWAQFAAEQGLTAPGALGSSPEVVDADLSPDQVAVAVARWGVEPGDIWACGRHRVGCGDCLEAEVIERLLGDVVPTMVMADPPYGVNIVQVNGYVGGGEAYHIPFGGVKRDSRKRVSGGQRTKARTGHYPIETWGKERRGTVGGSVDGVPSHKGLVGKYAPVLGDESTSTAIQASAQYLATYPQAVQVWWGGNYYANALPASTCWLVWNKETTGHFADCELAWTNQPRAARLFTHRWNGMLRASEHERRWHPTQKPAALMAWVYEVVGTPDAVVLDPFLGSGPTLLAAEQRGQTVYGCELSPDCVAMALERWARLTQETPQRVDSQ